MTAKRLLALGDGWEQDHCGGCIPEYSKKFWIKNFIIVIVWYVNYIFIKVFNKTTIKVSVKLESLRTY